MCVCACDEAIWGVDWVRGGRKSGVVSSVVGGWSVWTSPRSKRPLGEEWDCCKTGIVADTTVADEDSNAEFFERLGEEDRDDAGVGGSEGSACR